jgi:phytoene synthase
MEGEVCDSLARSYAYCEEVAQKEARNFYPAFRLLPAPKRRAMCALYAFLRIADDLSDGPGSPTEKQAALSAWREQFAQALAGEYCHPLHPALHDTIRVFGIPSIYLQHVIDGVEMDLRIASYATFSDLYRYCYHVASAVGLSCIHIWGFDSDKAKAPAEKAGIAFQLTNILRDLPEDAARGRLYLPQEDLARFGYAREELTRHVQNESFRNLMKFQIERARQYYDQARPLSACLHPAGRSVFRAMTVTYRAILDAIELRDYDVFSRRVSISPWRKLLLVLQLLPTRFGWT